MKELHADRANRRLSLDADLEADLGIGSLERAELFYRIEEHFQIQFPEEIIIKSSTLRDILKALSSIPSEKIKPKNITATLLLSSVDVTQTSTLIDILKIYAESDPDRPHIYFQNEQGNETIITYGKLWSEAKSIAQGFRERKLSVGDTVAIMLPTCEQFFTVFFGVLLAGGIPVPIYPPFRPDRIEEYAQRETNILQNAEIRFLVTFQQIESLGKLLQAFVPSLKEVVTPDMLISTNTFKEEITIDADSPALIQYTSGSTALPKGVLLTHGNLLANLRSAGQAIQIQPTDGFVSWLPLYHDMGLIGAWFGSLYYGVPATILSPLTFLSRPERWLWAIHYHRATISAAPNFAYELCIRKIKDADIEGLDLSSWRIAFNGAEAVQAETLKRFTERFSPYGFRAEALTPVYGLAENTVALAFPPLDRKPRIDSIDRVSLEKKGLAIPTNHADAIQFVSCGKAIPHHEIRIVDSHNIEVAERIVGSLQFSGPSMMQGYYHNPEATQAIYHDGWFDSGDFAYQAGSEIFITGRKKDLIIKAGRNIYPESLEAITSQIEGVRQGCVAAFGVTSPITGTEQIIIVAEIKEKNDQQKEKIIAEITEKITYSIGFPPDQVVLVSPGTIPKTSSGKLQRSTCKQNYLSHTLTMRRLPVWMQIGRLWISSVAKKTVYYAKQLAKLGYAFYIGILLLFFMPVTLITLYFAPKKWFASWLKTTARALFWLGGCPLHIIGKEYITSTAPLVFIANHASYIDALALLTILPNDVAFVGKKELLNLPFLRTAFKKLNYATLDRMEFSQNITDATYLEEVLKQGTSLMIFPEGTFTYATGVRPFKQGAFKIAVDTQTSICPIALRGTRTLLREGQILPCPAPVTITIMEPLKPQNHGWHEVTRLRTLARDAIAEKSGEHMLDLTTAGPKS